MRRPNIAVLACGHSGSSIATKMLSALGWELGEHKERVAENLNVQRVNKEILATQGICPCGSDQTEADGPMLFCHRCQRTTKVPDKTSLPSEVVSELPQPHVIKDPRLVVTWPYWGHALKRHFVLHVERNLDRMAQTYRRYSLTDAEHPYGHIYGHDVRDLVAMARKHYEDWRGPKLSLDYEQIADAVGLFDMGRAK